MLIRPATIYDRDAVLKLGEAAYVEARYTRYPFNAAKLERLFDMTQGDNASLFLLVAEHEGVLVGFVLGLVTEHFFASMVYATYMALYLVPAHRRGRNGMRLIQSFEQEAIRRGADEILIGNSSNIEPTRVATLFSACGYRLIGANAIKYVGE